MAAGQPSRAMLPAQLRPRSQPALATETGVPASGLEVERQGEHPADDPPAERPAGRIRPRKDPGQRDAQRYRQRATSQRQQQRVAQQERGAHIWQADQAEPGYAAHEQRRHGPRSRFHRMTSHRPSVTWLSSVTMLPTDPASVGAVTVERPELISQRATDTGSVVIIDQSRAAGRRV